MNSASKLATALLLAAGLSAPQAAAAQSLVDASEVQTIATVAREFGSVDVDTDSTGDPMLSGQMGETSYAVFFYGCTDGADCQTIQMMSSWVNPGEVNIDTVNTWNREKRFGKAYLDDEGDPVLEMNVNLFAGVSETNLSDTFDWWRVVLDVFEEYIGFDTAGTPDAPPAPPATREAGSGSDGSPSSAIGMGQSGGGKVKANK